MVVCVVILLVKCSIRSVECVCDVSPSCDSCTTHIALLLFGVPIWQAPAKSLLSLFCLSGPVDQPIMRDLKDYVSDPAPNNQESCH